MYVMDETQKLQEINSEGIIYNIQVERTEIWLSKNFVNFRQFPSQ